MIDARPSLEAAKRLSGTELLTYLVANGWVARSSLVDGISIVSKEVPGANAPAEFILPVKPGFEDEHRRVADALRTIAAIEKRSEASVASAVRGVSLVKQKQETRQLRKLRQLEKQLQQLHKARQDS